MPKPLLRPVDLAEKETTLAEVAEGV